MSSDAIEWQWSTFERLSGIELYALLRARQEVFTVEQNCPYQDADNLDQEAFHLLGWDTETRCLATYLRVLPSGKYAEPSIGRVLTRGGYRGTGLGRDLINTAIARTQEAFPGQSIRISAQEHLKHFYESFGFVAVSDPYIEDAIPHIEMLKAP